MVPGNGLNNRAQNMMTAVSADIHIRVASNLTVLSRKARAYGMAVVKTELPAVTKPFTTPKYFLK
jgi:hypothetical protein